MGYSCSTAASKTMQALYDLHKASGHAGCFRYRGELYFMEHSRVEHADGSVTGRVNQITKWDYQLGSGWSVPVGSFKIRGADGLLERAPASLKYLMQLVLRNEVKP